MKIKKVELNDSVCESDSSTRRKLISKPDLKKK